MMLEMGRSVSVYERKREWWWSMKWGGRLESRNKLDKGQSAGFLEADDPVPSPQVFVNLKHAMSFSNLKINPVVRIGQYSLLIEFFIFIIYI